MVRLRTAVYIKMNSRDQLLSLEGVCHQLRIVSYHWDIEDITPQGNKQPVVPLVRVKYRVYGYPQGMMLKSLFNWKTTVHRVDKF